MPTHIFSSDIARAAGVSQRSVQTFLGRTYPRPEGWHWHRFEAWRLPALVDEVKAARKRNRRNVFNSPPRLAGKEIEA